MIRGGGSLRCRYCFKWVREFFLFFDPFVSVKFRAISRMGFGYMGTHDSLDSFVSLILGFLFFFFWKQLETL